MLQSHGLFALAKRLLQDIVDKISSSADTIY